MTKYSIISPSVVIPSVLIIYFNLCAKNQEESRRHVGFPLRPGCGLQVLRNEFSEALRKETKRENNSKFTSVTWN